MHIYFSGIGGTGVGPAALVAKQAGYTVSGSDSKQSQYIAYLKERGISDIHIGQTRDKIAETHARQPIDWFIYTPAVPRENPNNPELVFCRENNIKMTSEDELIIEILSQKKLKLIAVAGTHGKTTTTAMVVWMLKQLGIPVSWSVGAKISFGDMGHFDQSSEYFILEADEFERNFLKFHPHLSIIPGIGWDHHEIYKTEDEYMQAFGQFVNQSDRIVLWVDDFKKLNVSSNSRVTVEQGDNPGIDKIELLGLYNRRNAWLVIQAVHHLTKKPIDKLIELMNDFPGLSRRHEQIRENLYSDYAHTPEKILGGMSVALEAAAKTGQNIAVIYEPLTNRRMYHTANLHKDVFRGAHQIYWVPSFLAREDPALPILKPAELIKHLSDDLQKIAEPAELDDELARKVQQHLDRGDLVLAMSGGGGGSLDEWLRQKFSDS